MTPACGAAPHRSQIASGRAAGLCTPVVHTVAGSINVCLPPLFAQDVSSAPLPAAGPPAGKLQLSQQRLAEFGGVREVVHQFKAAPCSASRCNMLSVMLDHIAWHLSEVRPHL